MLILIHRSSTDDMRLTIRNLGTELVGRYDTGVRYTDRAIHIDTNLTYKHIDIFGRCGNPVRCEGLKPDFWYSDRRDLDRWFKSLGKEVNGIRLDHTQDVLKIVDILVKDGVKKCRL